MAPAEIIKEYVIQVEGLDHPVKGRIIKSVEGDSAHLYHGQVSHYCKQDERAAEAYYPSQTFESLNTAESRVLDYLRSFTTLDVIPNKWY